MCLTMWLSIPLSHVPNNVWMLLGVFMLKVIYIDRHNSFARGHSRKRCFTDSLWSQKQHLVLPTQFLLVRLSLVRITPLWTNHIKILIRSGTLIFQKWNDLDSGPVPIKSRYIDFTEKTPVVFNFQWIVSSRSDSWTSINLQTSCNQASHRSPTRDLLKWILSGTEFNTVAT